MLACGATAEHFDGWRSRIRDAEDGERDAYKDPFEGEIPTTTRASVSTKGQPPFTPHYTRGFKCRGGTMVYFANVKHMLDAWNHAPAQGDYRVPRDEQVQHWSWNKHGTNDRVHDSTGDPNPQCNKPRIHFPIKGTTWSGTLSPNEALSF